VTGHGATNRFAPSCARWERSEEDFLVRVRQQSYRTEKRFGDQPIDDIIRDIALRLCFWDLADELAG
jgi:hypothetical protein